MDLTLLKTRNMNKYWIRISTDAQKETLAVTDYSAYEFCNVSVAKKVTDRCS